MYRALFVIHRALLVIHRALFVTDKQRERTYEKHVDEKGFYRIYLSYIGLFLTYMRLFWSYIRLFLVPMSNARG